MTEVDHLTLVSEKRLRELLKIEQAAKALREGLEYAYHCNCTNNDTCEICRVIAYYDKEVKHEWTFSVREAKDGET